MLALVALVVIGGLVWKHLPVSGPIALGGGPRPANWNQIQHGGPVLPIPHPTLGANRDLASKVGEAHLDHYRSGLETAVTAVDCPAVTSPGLDTKRSSWGATGEFYDCNLSFADRTSTVECWFRAGDKWRRIFGIPAPDPNLRTIPPPIDGPCEFFAQDAGHVGFTDLSA